MNGPIVEESHRVAVVARYLGPTDYRGSRIKVCRGDHTSGDKQLTVGWDHSLGLGENYAAAIRQFLELMEWDGRWVVGGTTDGYVAVWCATNETRTTTSPSR